MELSLTLSVLVMSDESSQMGDFFFFIWSITDSGNGGGVSRRVPLSYIGLLQDSLHTVCTQEMAQAERQTTGILHRRLLSSSPSTALTA